MIIFANNNYQAMYNCSYSLPILVLMMPLVFIFNISNDNFFILCVQVLDAYLSFESCDVFHLKSSPLEKKGSCKF